MTSERKEAAARCAKPYGPEPRPRLRELLRRHMEAEGFSVFQYEWWHFDYRDWKSYALQNVRFEDIGITKAKH